MSWRIFKYLQHCLHLRHRRGHGIHSPFLFRLVNGVIFNADAEQIPEALLDRHRELRSAGGTLPPDQIGMPSRAGGRGPRSIASFARRSSVGEKQAALLYRLSHYWKAGQILELGTGLGISTLYLSAGSPGSEVHSIEGSGVRAQKAAELLHGAREEGLSGEVFIHQGLINELLPGLAEGLPGHFLAFVDGDHSYPATIAAARVLADKASEKSMIILDDIHWSRDMHRAWREVLGWPECRQSIDLFHMGILLFREDVEPLELKIKI